MDKSGSRGTWTFHATEALTKRELFAALAMAAIVPIIHPMTDFDKRSLNEVIAIQAVRLADALLAELAKEEGA